MHCGGAALGKVDFGRAERIAIAKLVLRPLESNLRGTRTIHALQGCIEPQAYCEQSDRNKGQSDAVQAHPVKLGVCTGLDWRRVIDGAVGPGEEQGINNRIEATCTKRDARSQSEKWDC